MRELVVGSIKILICLAGGWFIFNNAPSWNWHISRWGKRWGEPNWWDTPNKRWEKLFAYGVPILLGVTTGLTFHSWAMGLVFLSPLEWAGYFEILNWAEGLGRYRNKPQWPGRLLAFGMPILLGISTGLVSSSWLVGLVFLTPLGLPFGFLTLCGVGRLLAIRETLS